MKTIITIFLLLIGTSWASAQTDDGVVIPNVFTPNGDGVNDLFKVKSSGFTAMECEIYNRYGEIVYVFYGLNGHWDGRTLAGLRCSDGVYFYVVKLSNGESEPVTKSGSVQIISGHDRPN